MGGVRLRAQGYVGRLRDEARGRDGGVRQELAAGIIWIVPGFTAA
jgi:hypothetical protein